MADIGVAVIMGIVEGLTEFLPVSSTGHLIICKDLLLERDDDFWNTFLIVIQLGAILSVVFYFKEKILFSIKNSVHNIRSRNFLLSILLAFIPTAVIGLLLHQWIKAHFFNPTTVGVVLVLGGVAIIIIEKMKLPGVTNNVEEISFRQAFLIGCTQCLSVIFPGMSRSAATIMGGMVFGLNRTAAVEFSFFLAIPTMTAATVYSLFSDMSSLNRDNLMIIGIGFIVSMGIALAVISWFMGFIKKYTFIPFAWYRIVFGSLLLIFILLKD